MIRVDSKATRPLSAGRVNGSAYFLYDDTIGCRGSKNR